MWEPGKASRIWAILIITMINDSYMCLSKEHEALLYKTSRTGFNLMYAIASWRSVLKALDHLRNWESTSTKHSHEPNLTA